MNVRGKAGNEQVVKIVYQIVVSMCTVIYLAILSRRVKAEVQSAQEKGNVSEGLQSTIDSIMLMRKYSLIGIASRGFMYIGGILTATSLSFSNSLLLVVSWFGFVYLALAIGSSCAVAIAIELTPTTRKTLKKQVKEK